MPPRTAFYAPAHRINNKSNIQGVNPPVAPDAAPSLDFAGSGIQDHRLPYNMFNGANAATAIGVLGWYGADTPRTLNVIPSTLHADTIAAAAHVVLGTAMTLAGASTGITVVPAGGLLVAPAMNVIPAGALVLDGNPAIFRYGTGFISAFYDPTKMLSRAVSITGVSAGAGGDFLVSGWDVYGEPMTDTITVAAGVNTVNSLKAFKFVGSIVPQFTDAQNYSVGTADVFGLPIFGASFFDQTISWNATAIVAATGFVAGDVTAPTALTGDVRGTYATQSASDGTKRLIVSQRPSLSQMVTSGISIGLFGQVQA
jgi:hypothetical protein